MPLFISESLFQLHINLSSVALCCYEQYWETPQFQTEICWREDVTYLWCIFEVRLREGYVCWNTLDAGEGKQGKCNDLCTPRTFAVCKWELPRALVCVFSPSCSLLTLGMPAFKLALAFPLLTYSGEDADFWRCPVLWFTYWPQTCKRNDSLSG